MQALFLCPYFVQEDCNLTYIEAIILGLVQGLTEFLPVSSSGHLLIVQHFLGISGDSVLIFTILLHVGTLISIFFCYWKDILALIIELFLTFRDIFTGRGLRLDRRPVRKLGVMIIVASIPTAIIGFAFNDLFDVCLESAVFPDLCISLLDHSENVIIRYSILDMSVDQVQEIGYLAVSFISLARSGNDHCFPRRFAFYDSLDLGKLCAVCQT